MISATDKPRQRVDHMGRAWRIAGAARTTGVLLALVTVTLAVAVILQPMIGSFSLYEGEFTGVVGVVRLLGDLWLHILLALLAYNLLLRLAEGARRTYRAWRPSPTISQRPADLATEQATTNESLEQVLRRLEPLLAYYERMEIERQPARAQVYAEHHRVGLIGPMLACLGALVLMLGLLVNDAAGWQAKPIVLAPQDSVAPTQAPDLNFTLEEIAGEGSRAASTVRLTDADGVSTARRARHFWPARWGKMWVFQRDTGPALTVSATDASGKPLLIQSLAGDDGVSEEAHILFGETQTEQAFAIPTRNLAFRAVSYASLPEQNIDRPVFLVEAFQGDDPSPLVSELVEDRTVLRLSDVTVQLHAERHAVLSLNYLPGISGIIAGGLITLAGLGVVLLWGYREIWCDLTSNGQHGVGITLGVVAPFGAAREQARLLAALQNHEGPGNEL